MEHIKEAVEEYLKEENSSYAILLTGKWGIGKTHYYNNELAPMINTTNTIEDNSKPYKAVYISLFGLKSIKDLQLEVFWTINKVIPQKKKKAIGQLLTPITTFFSKYYTGISINMGSIASLIIKSIVKYDDIVLCFDDLERRHSNLSLQEIIAFINNLTEHEKAKVLIIANEDQINKETYKNVKEKVIHDTLLFEPDWKTQVETFIENHYGKKSAFGDFLLNKLEDIIKLSEDANCNLRTLDFTLKKIQKIYCQLEANNYSFSNSAVEKAVYQFAILTCVQYKMEAIDFSHRTALSQLFSPSKSLSQLQKRVESAKKSNDKSKEDKFHSKILLSIRKKIFLDSIFCFITGKIPIDLELLEIEIEKLNSIIPNPMLPQNKLLEKLQWTPYLDFSDEEYSNLHKNILKHAKKGDYLLWEYPTIFYLLMRCGEQLYNYKAAEITKQLEEGILKAPKMRSSIYPTVDSMTKESLDAFKHIVQYKKLENLVKKQYQEATRKEEEKKIEEFRQNFTEEWESRMEQLKKGEFRDTFFDKDFAQTVYDTALSSQKFIKQLFSFFKETDFLHSDKKLVLQEIDFLEELTKKLSQYLEENTKRDIKHLALEHILEYRQKRIITLKNHLQNNPNFHNTPPSTPTIPPSISGEI